MLAETIIQLVLTQVNDNSHVRWSLDDKLRWLNEGQRFVVTFRPDANAVNRVVTLVSGVKQTIPSTAIRFLRLYRNMGADGTTAGKGITFVDLDEMSRSTPDWPADTAEVTVSHYMNDTQDRQNYYVWPPVHASTIVQVEGLFSDTPTDVPLEGTYQPLTDKIAIADSYSNPLIDYILFRLYAADGEGGSARLSALHMQAAMAMLGVAASKDVIAQQAVREALHQDQPLNPQALAL